MGFGWMGMGGFFFVYFENCDKEISNLNSKGCLAQIKQERIDFIEEELNFIDWFYFCLRTTSK